MQISGTGLQAIKDVFASSRKQGTAVLISGTHAQPLIALNKAGLMELFGEENVLATFDEALKRARIFAAEV